MEDVQFPGRDALYRKLGERSRTGEPDLYRAPAGTEALRVWPRPVSDRRREGQAGREAAATPAGRPGRAPGPASPSSRWSSRSAPRSVIPNACRACALEASSSKDASCPRTLVGVPAMASMSPWNRPPCRHLVVTERPAVQRHLDRLRGTGNTKAGLRSPQGACQRIGASGSPTAQLCRKPRERVVRAQAVLHTAREGGLGRRTSLRTRLLQLDPQLEAAGFDAALCGLESRPSLTRLVPRDGRLRRAGATRDISLRQPRRLPRLPDQNAQRRPHSSRYLIVKTRDGPHPVEIESGETVA